MYVYIYKHVYTYIYTYFYIYIYTYVYIHYIRYTYIKLFFEQKHISRGGTNLAAAAAPALRAYSSASDGNIPSAGIDVGHKCFQDNTDSLTDDSEKNDR